MVRILLVDDHLLFRKVVREIVERETDLEVVAEAGDGEMAVQQAIEVQPDVVLMDLSMPGCDGFQATQQILACSPDSRVVIFSASAEEQHVLRALQCGAIGYLTKDADAEGLLTAIRQAAQNDLYMAPPLSIRLLALLRTLKIERAQRGETPHTHKPTAPTAEARGSLDHTSAAKMLTFTEARRPKCKRHLPLSEREQQILNLIRQGQRNREIASELRIAESTVHKHVANIFEKLDARNRAEALFLAETHEDGQQALRLARAHTEVKPRTVRTPGPEIVTSKTSTSRPKALAVTSRTVNAKQETLATALSSTSRGAPAQ